MARIGQVRRLRALSRASRGGSATLPTRPRGNLAVTVGVPKSKVARELGVSRVTPDRALDGTGAYAGVGV